MNARRRTGLRTAAATAAAALVMLNGGVAHAAGPDLLTWGQNNQGQLGDGTTTNRTTPVFPTLSPGTSVVDIAGGQEDHSAFLLSTGQLFTMGNNQFGQLGNGVTGGFSSTPVAVVSTGLPAGVTWVDVSAGANHTVARASDGSVWSWGIGNSGQLGNGANANSNVPVAVSLPPGETAVAVAAGWNHSLVVTASGGILAWGGDNGGQLGNGAPLTNSNIPVTAVLPGGAGTPVAVAANGYNSVALDDAGATFVWGQGPQGELCNGANTATQAVPLAVTLPGGALAASIGAGRVGTYYVTTTGTVYGCGENNNGELGDGTTTNRNTPTLMTLAPGAVATAVAGGRDHTLVLTTAGKVLATGYNGQGQLGDGTTTQRLTPIASLVGAGTTLNLIATGSNQSMAVGTFSLTGVPLATPWMAVGGTAVGGLLALGWVAHRRRRAGVVASA